MKPPPIINIYNNRFPYVLGQLWVLQACVLELAPEHWFPPYWGAGFVHDLDFDCEPPPHVTEHEPQDVHDVYPPWTKTKETQSIVIILNDVWKIQGK